MPSVPVHPPGGSTFTSARTNPLPQLLHTPSGLALLELQGEIHAPPPIADETPGDQGGSPQEADTAVGKLVFPNYSPSSPPEDTSWMKGVYLYIGKHQRLTGEVKKLPKAMGVLRRREVEGDDQEQLEIVEIVKHKIVFSQRPEPVSED
jgi:hypothetical protein